MQPISEIQKTLLSIYSSKTMDELESFQNEDAWMQMNADERELLALLFIMKGELSFKNQRIDALKHLAMAEKTAPTNPKVLCRIALAILSESQEESFVLEALRVAETAVNLEPTFFDAWYIWGNALVAKGVLKQDIEEFLEAEQKYQKASGMASSVNIKPEIFLWRWGLCWHLIAKQSGEASDYSLAIKKYKQAADLGLKTALFFNDFGNAFVDLGCLLTRPEYFIEASKSYEESIKLQPDFFEGLFNKACCYQRIYEMQNNLELCEAAEVAFERASNLSQNDAPLWFRWAQLLVKKGKNEHNPDALKQSLDKFESAHQLNPDHPHIKRDWSEVLIIIGAAEKKLAYIRKAETLIAEAAEAQPDHAFHWSVWGMCLNELGNYFDEESYYLKAIEKFQHAVSLDRNNPLIWYGLATSHYALGSLMEEVNHFEKSARFFARANECGDRLFPRFWYEWGLSLLHLGELMQDHRYLEAAIDKFEDAFKFYQEHQDISEIDPKWLYHYGCALDLLGDITDNEKAYERAIQILTQVLILDPQFMLAHYNLALVYSHLAELTWDVEGFYKAIEHLQVVIAHDPEDDLAWNDWGLVYIHLSQLLNEPSQPDLQQKLYVQAENKLIHAVSLGNTQAYYNLACLHSLMGNFTMSLHYLERADAFESLPSLEEMLQDEWLDALRATSNFQYFLQEFSTQLPDDELESK